MRPAFLREQAPSQHDLEAGGEGDEADRPRGFDRLMAAGLTADDVAALRAMFATQVAQVDPLVPDVPGKGFPQRSQRLRGGVCAGCRAAARSSALTCFFVMSNTHR